MEAKSVNFKQAKGINISVSGYCMLFYHSIVLVHFRVR